MDLLISLLKQAADSGHININIDFSEKIEQIVHDECFVTLVRIYNILDNYKLSDFDCIEKIVGVFEEIGFNGGTRHDFG